MLAADIERVFIPLYCPHQTTTSLSPALSPMTASPTKHGQLPPLKPGMDSTERLLRALPIDDCVVTGENARVTDGAIVLTEASHAQIGHACFQDPIVLLAGASHIHLRFNYLMECGTGAYGISVGLVDASKPGWKETRVSGGTLTYTGLNYTGRPGALSGVGLDTSGKFAAKGSIGKQQGTVVLQGGEASGFETVAQAKHPVMTKGGCWKRVDVIWRVSVGHVVVSVAVDGKDVLKEARAEGLVLPRELGIVFGASATNTRHSVRDVQISGGGTFKSLDQQVVASATDALEPSRKLSELESEHQMEASGADMPSLRDIVQGNNDPHGSKQQTEEESEGDEAASSEREPESGQDGTEDDANAALDDRDDGPSEHEVREASPDESQEGSPRQEATDPETAEKQDDEALVGTEGSKDTTPSMRSSDSAGNSLEDGIMGLEPELDAGTSGSFCADQEEMLDAAGAHEGEAAEADEPNVLETDEQSSEDVPADDEQRAATDPEEVAPPTPRKEESHELPPETGIKTPHAPADIA